MLAVLTVGDIWEIDKEDEATKVFGTTNNEHPAVGYLFHSVGSHYVGGELEGIQLPLHYDFRRLRKTPSDVRSAFSQRGWSKVVAFQTRNPMHRAHVELTMRAAAEQEANLLIHPVVGMTKPGDVDHYTRVRVYQAIQARYEEGIRGSGAIAAGDADGRATRGGLARSHSQESRRKPLHRWSRSRRTWIGQQRNTVLRAI